MSVFPQLRMRCLRRTEALRRLVRETALLVDDLVQPLFVVPGKHIRQEIPSMPGICHLSVDYLVREVQEIAALGIPGILLFGLPTSKDESGSEAYSAAGTVQQAVAAIKAAIPDLIVITDVCLCQYTSHGHCGILDDSGCVDNDRTVELIARTALSHTQAGADIVAPSDMMDGRVAAIRRSLDRSDFQNRLIMAYAAKYCSAFYGPFREAAESAPKSGNRSQYQMDPANIREALREVELDIEEGADIVMVKPALSYLDVIRKVRETYDHPLAAYSVSGEYSMLKAAARAGWIDEKRAATEVLLSIKRAGADFIITYYAKEAAQWLRQLP
ncbi:MAG: porphobilinogen synthase [Dehalococcoidia bacterium]|nr:porphobilinogen synthase [Dehalococcoidia bacterium]